MKVKHFTVSLSPNTTHDTQVMEAALAGLDVRKISTQFVPAEVDFWSVLVFYEDAKQGKSPNKEAVALTESDLTPDDTRLLAALRTWRLNQAREQDVPEYLICANSALIGVAKHRPSTPEALTTIPGLGYTKVARYGGDLLTIVKAF